MQILVKWKAQNQYLPVNAESEDQAVEYTLYDDTHAELLKAKDHHLWDVFSWGCVCMWNLWSMYVPLTFLSISFLICTQKSLKVC